MVTTYFDFVFRNQRCMLYVVCSRFYTIVLMCLDKPHTIRIEQNVVADILYVHFVGGFQIMFPVSKLVI